MLSKGEKRGRPGSEKNREGQKDKSRDCCVTFTVLAQNYFKIWLSVHAPKLQEIIFHTWNRRPQSDQLTKESLGLGSLGLL